SIARGLDEAARGLRTTTFCLLLAAQKAMLAKLCGVDDVMVLAVNSGREFPLLERTVGYMADRTFYRTDVGADPSLAELVERVRQTMRQADRRQFWRYDLLQEDRGPGATIAAPAFNFYRRDNGPPTDGVWARIEPFPLRPPPGRSDPGAGVTGYWCVLTQEGEALKGQVRYRGDFPVDFPTALATVLEQVCGDPHLRLSRLRI
ncbi:MAG TPA: condensation domain-containing protein, partial [Caulobacter sp.]|nr:condensation domain-containing protein [Caulobacter sp.]